jgi:hypothetical protein
MEKRIVIALLTIGAFILAKNGGKLLRLIEVFAAQDVEVRSVIYKFCWYVVCFMASKRCYPKRA